jgi:hypothetical protein
LFSFNEKLNQVNNIIILESPLIISVGAKDSGLTLTRSNTETTSFINVESAVNIEFGCGIGPKIFLNYYNSNPIIGIVSQSINRK